MRILTYSLAVAMFKDGASLSGKGRILTKFRDFSREFDKLSGEIAGNPDNPSDFGLPTLAVYPATWQTVVVREKKCWRLNWLHENKLTLW